VSDPSPAPRLCSLAGVPARRMDPWDESHRGKPAADHFTRLVQTTSQPNRHFLIMLYHRRSLIFGRGRLEARVLPVSLDRGGDLETTFWHWTARELSTLPRSRESDLGVLFPRVTTELFRGKSFVVVDVVVSSYSHHLALEAWNEYVRFFDSIDSP
jgi:hypothetical protein